MKNNSEYFTNIDLNSVKMHAMHWLNEQPIISIMNAKLHKYMIETDRWKSVHLNPLKCVHFHKLLTKQNHRLESS